MVLTSCSADAPKGVPTGELCQSSLSARAQEALDRLSLHDRYEESGMGYENAVDRLRTGKDVPSSGTTVCVISTLEDGKEKSLVGIQFMRYGTYRTWPKELEPHDSHYRMGLFGHAGGGEAHIVFPCRSGLSRDAPPVIAGHAGAHDDYYGDAVPQLPEPERSRALMVLLHSATRIMAEKAGCLDEAGIPAQLPKPAPASDYRMPPSSLEEMEKDFVGEAKAEGT
ncbi:hypothetical protein [Streptomyces sp. NPDC003023]|uniref:hypothetical protein n=1 Tax=Streptomyces sp. NPDC003023 TaxID=3364675 RepID=UPI0036928722